MFMHELHFGIKYPIRSWYAIKQSNLLTILYSSDYSCYYLGYIDLLMSDSKFRMTISIKFCKF